MTQVNSSNKQLVIMQWNARSALANKHSLCNFLHAANVDIALICETWFKPNSVVKFKGYNVIKNDRYDGYAGVAILIKCGITYKTIDIPDSFNQDILVCGAEIVYSNKSLHFLSVYRAPHVTSRKEDWLNLFSCCPSPCVIAGDFNAHNTSWGSLRNDHIGSQILQAIDHIDLVLLNDGSCTKISPPGTEKSAIDLTICNADIAHDLHWSITTDSLGSDHLPIMITTEIQMEQIIIYPKSKWNVKRADWYNYHQECETLFITPPTSLNVDDKLDFLKCSINEAATKSIPIYMPFCASNRQPAPWWDSDCYAAIQNRRSALQKYKTDPSMINFLKYKQVCAQTKRFLKSKARISWKSYCSQLNRNTPMGDVWKQARIMRRLPTNRRTTNDDCWTEEFYKSITPDSVHLPIEKAEDQTDCKSSFLTNAFTLQELNVAIDCRKDTAPGLDDIKYPMIANLPFNAKTFLLSIYNDIWVNGESATGWNAVAVIPILKPNKNPILASSYRPISLLSCLFKTFERLIKARLEWWFTIMYPLPCYHL